MYSPALDQQLITARVDDIRRARHGQPAGHAAAFTRASAGSRNRHRFPLTLPRLRARFAH
jgi:hypothetical protein